jgi:ubiquinone/menaquinone biosynthesis C-methylase UbiE
MQHAFDNKIEAWVQYNTSAGGKLRHAVILQHLQAQLPPTSARILDVGGGTGEMAADLAKMGHAVTMLDFSLGMIEQAGRHCDESKVTLVYADASQLEALFQPESFDLVLCHSLLEFVDDPPAFLIALARVARSQGLLSIVVGNRYHFSLRAALLAQDFHQARLSLDDEIPTTDLFGLPRHTFYPEEVQHMIKAAQLRMIGEFGVRIFADLLGKPLELNEDLLALELAASARLPYRRLARFIQFIARKE